jgi:hypothetical protein
MTLFAPGLPVIVGVDTVLRTLSLEAVGSLPDPVTVTVGPLDRPVGSARLNWFLYRITPAPAYLNMEYPDTGWTTRRGRPPLALTLHYLLSAEPGELTEAGDDETGVHAALTAVMNALHDNGIFGLSSLIATGPDRTVQDVTTALAGMTEPLRVTMAPVPIETMTALWTTGSRAIRLSVGYEVSLVTVPVDTPFVSGPPVLERVLGVGPSRIPVIESVSPSTLWFGSTATVTATGLNDDVAVTLSRLAGDPDDPTDGRPNPATTHSTGPWLLPSLPAAGGVTIGLPGPGLVPGARMLTLTNTLNGLAAGSAHAPLTVVPAVESAAGPLVPGAATTLAADHVVAPGRVFFAGLAAPFTVTTPATLPARAQISVTVPDGLAAGGTVGVSLQVGPVTGPTRDLAVQP